MNQQRLFSREEYDHAFRYSLSLAQNEDNAFDLLQTSFEKLLKKLVSGEEIPNLRGYLYRIIRNQFIDNVRHKKRWKWEEFPDEGNVAMLHPSQMEDLFLNRSEVEHLLKEVSPVERELLYLSAVEEYSVQEIADLTQTPKGTLLSRLHRLKLRIRNQYQQELQEKAQ